MYGDKKYKINLNLSDIEHINEDGEMAPVSFFDNVLIADLMKCIEEQINDELIPVAMQRIAYSDYGLVDAALSFKELQIKQGSTLYLFKGPYIFKGSTMKDINWPFRRNDTEHGLLFIGLYAMIDPPRGQKVYLHMIQNKNNTK